MAAGMIGRKVGMMRLYDGSGRARAVTVLELGPNRVTQVRTTERDGYEAVQVGFSGNRKRLNRPERGHLRKGNIDEPLSVLKEFRAQPGDGTSYERGQTLTVEQFTPGEFVNIAGVSKGRGFAGGVRRWNFRGGPKTHGQSDRHRAPGSVGAGTTPGKVWKGQKMAGHMGAETKTILNLLVVLMDPARNLLFVEGSVPGAKSSVVTVTRGRRAPLRNFAPPAPLAAPEDLAPVAPIGVAADEANQDEEATMTQDQNQQQEQPGDAEEAGAEHLAAAHQPQAEGSPPPRHEGRAAETVVEEAGGDVDSEMQGDAPGGGSQS